MARRKKTAVRRRWKIHPATRVEKNVKIYDRRRAKKLLRNPHAL